MKISNQSIVLATILLFTTAISAQAQPARSYNFQCAQGKQFRATFAGDRAIVKVGQRSLTLQQVRTASGIRYQSGQYTLSSKGNQAELTRNNKPFYQNCTVMSTASETVSGTVTYRERIALPPDSVVRVTLESVGSPMEVLAERTIETQGQQVPIPFSLTYDASSLREDTSYVIRAQILVDKQLRFAGDADYSTEQKPAKVEVLVRSISPSPR
jgi:putative lipoprotein